jgi:hypothetical protein
MRLENEASHAYLSMVLHVQSCASPADRAACDVEQRLVTLCVANLERFERVSPGSIKEPLMASDGEASAALEGCAPVLPWRHLCLAGCLARM